MNYEFKKKVFSLMLESFTQDEKKSLLEFKSLHNRFYNRS